MAAFLRRLATNEVVQPAPLETRDGEEVFIPSYGKEQTHLSLTEACGVGTVVPRFHYIDVRDAEASDLLFYLDCTVRLHGGSVVFGCAGEFANILDGGEEFAILGGTGSYSDVTGQVTMTPRIVGDPTPLPLRRVTSPIRLR